MNLLHYASPFPTVRFIHTHRSRSTTTTTSPLSRARLFTGESAISDSGSEVLQRARSCRGCRRESLSSLCRPNFLSLLSSLIARLVTEKMPERKNKLQHSESLFAASIASCFLLFYNANYWFWKQELYSEKMLVHMMPCVCVCLLLLLVKSSLFSSDGRIVEKNDQTPVTVADFGVQALNWANCPLVAEEDSAFVRSNNLEDPVVKAVTRQASAEDKPWTHDDVLKAIDGGGKEAFTFGTKPATYWVLDPIDGTRGFLKGSRAAVYIHRAKVQTSIKIWDHAVGIICLLEAGGKVTDWKGSQVDLAADKDGRRIIYPSGGILVTNGNLHDQILDKISSVSSNV